MAFGLLMVFSMGCSFLQKFTNGSKSTGNTRSNSTPLRPDNGKTAPGVKIPGTRGTGEVNLLGNGDDIQDFLSKLSEATGSDNPNLLKLSFYDTYAMVEVQDPKKPDNVDAYTYRNGELTGPNPVKLIGNGRIGDNVFPLKDVNVAGIPALTQEILDKLKDVEGGKLIGYSIKRNLPFSKDVRIQPLTDATRKSVTIEADKNAKLKKLEIK